MVDINRERLFSLLVLKPRGLGPKREPTRVRRQATQVGKEPQKR